MPPDAPSPTTAPVPLLSAPEEVPPLTRVGNYLMLELLGEGAFGKVRLAVDQTSGKQFAIKVMHKSHIHQHELTLQVRREIAVMKAMNHPYIVNLHEVLNSSKNLYMVMDLVTGGELFDAVAEHGRLPEPTARLYFQQLVDGIQYCHSRRVYHRDLKPENLLLSDDKQTLKITDFGLSSIKQSNASSELLHTVMGSPHYIAPEIITSAANGYEGSKVDVWASGIILYGMLAGFLPFDEPDTRALYQAIVQNTPQFPKHFSYDVVKLLRAMLHKDPSKRPTMDIVKQFTWFKVDYEPVLSEERRPPQPRKERRKQRVRRSMDRVRQRTSRDHMNNIISHPDSARHAVDNFPQPDIKARQSIGSTGSSASGSSAGQTSDTSGRMHRSHWFDKPLEPQHVSQDTSQHAPIEVSFEDATQPGPRFDTVRRARDSVDMGALHSRYSQLDRRTSLGSEPRHPPTLSAENSKERRHWFDMPNRRSYEERDRHSSSPLRRLISKHEAVRPHSLDTATRVSIRNSGSIDSVARSPRKTEGYLKNSPSSASTSTKPTATTPASSTSSLQATWDRSMKSATPVQSEPRAEDWNGALSNFSKIVSLSSGNSPAPSKDSAENLKRERKLPDTKQALSDLASPLSAKSDITFTPSVSRQAQQLDMSKISGAIFSPFNSPLQKSEHSPLMHGFDTCQAPIFKPMTPQFAVLAETCHSKPTMAPSAFCPEVDDGEAELSTWCIDSMDVFADVESDEESRQTEHAVDGSRIRFTEPPDQQEQIAVENQGGKSIFSPLSNTMQRKLSSSKMSRVPKSFNLSNTLLTRSAK